MSAPNLTLPVAVPRDIGGATVMTYTLGAGGSPPRGDVVFCHGTPWSAQVWAHAARYLSDGYRVFLWDMPGYGALVQHPSVPVDLASQMSRFAQLLRSWDLQRPHIVAHDIGGAIALGAHLLHQREYASLYLWDTVVLEPWGSPFFRLVADHPAVFAALPDALHSALVKEYISGAIRRWLSSDLIDTLSAPWLEAAGQQAFYRQIAALRVEHTRPIVDRLGQLRCPAAIGWGQQDPWVAPAQAARLQHLLPGNPPILMAEGVGHLGPIEARREVCSAIESWLAQIPTPPG